MQTNPNYSASNYRIMQPAPCTTYSGRASDMDVHVVMNGKCSTHGVDNVGTVPAALATYIAAQAFQPHVIISAGTAGGFKSKVSARSVFFDAVKIEFAPGGFPVGSGTHIHTSTALCWTLPCEFEVQVNNCKV